MSAEAAPCPTCGLPIGVAPAHGPLWSPQVRGVEVCGCGSEMDQLDERIARVRHEIDDLGERSHPA